MMEWKILFINGHILIVVSSDIINACKIAKEKYRLSIIQAKIIGVANE